MSAMSTHDQPPNALILLPSQDLPSSESSTTDLHDLGTTELYTEQDTPDLSPPDYAPTPKQPDPDPYTDLSPHDLPVIEDQRPDPVVFSTDHYLPPVPPTTRPVALRGPIDRGEVFAEEPPLSDHAGALALPEAMSVQPPEHRQPDQVVSTPPAEEHTPPEPDNQGAGDSLPPPPRDHAKERGEEEPEEPGDRSGDKTGLVEPRDTVSGKTGQVPMAGEHSGIGQREIERPGTKGEGGRGIRAEVRSRCIDEVGYGIEAIRALVTAGTFDESEYDREPIQYILKDRIVEAAKGGDQDQAEADLDLLSQLSGVDGRPDVIAQACYATIVATSSQYAFNVLRRHLESERSQTIEKIASLVESRPDIWRPFIPLVILEELIRACEGSGTPPDTWINEYAIDAGHRWKLYAAHYLR